MPPPDMNDYDYTLIIINEMLIKSDENKSQTMLFMHLTEIF